MEYKIVNIDASNYARFSDMVYWRINGVERKTDSAPVSQRLQDELLNPNLEVYGVEVGQRLVGWISLVYIPKIGKYDGFGHVYVDELWVQREYRRNGFAEALMLKADEFAAKVQATGVRLYVGSENSGARTLYEKMGYKAAGDAVFMVKG